MSSSWFSEVHPQKVKPFAEGFCHNQNWGRTVPAIAAAKTAVAVSAITLGLSRTLAYQVRLESEEDETRGVCFCVATYAFPFDI